MGKEKSSAANVVIFVGFQSFEVIFVVLHLMLHCGGVQPAWNIKLELKGNVYSVQ